MSHFGRSGPPDIKDTYSLLILNITFRTSADDLFPLFDRYGKVVDVFIPRDRRTGESRGFAFVRYKHADEAQKAMEKLDGVNVNGRDIVVQLAKYGRSMERIDRGRMAAGSSKWNSRSDSRSPRHMSGRHYRNDYNDRDLRRDNNEYGRFERNHSRGTGRDSRRPGRGRSRSRSRSRSPGHSRAREFRRQRSRSRSFDRNVSQVVSRGSLSPRHLSSHDRAISPGPPRRLSSHDRAISPGPPRRLSSQDRAISPGPPRRLSSHDRVISPGPPRRLSSHDRAISPGSRHLSSHDRAISPGPPRHLSSHDHAISPGPSEDGGADDVSVSPVRKSASLSASRSRSVSPVNRRHASPEDEYID
ncbi:hypothetical protein O6H91_09G003600 [Diphasiastrum complanatum]|uniref:Uncharacterized protein n=1 Tax=Diphasiastrum complanatum TaxID=34168 RepID=A0ACC2CLM4_DIPCM|nr:hypothetical protein O6H91_09G003600 [Diphasiastrum complanatum]